MKKVLKQNQKVREELFTGLESLIAGESTPKEANKLIKKANREIKQIEKTIKSA